MKLKFTFLALLFFVLFQSKDFFTTLQSKPIPDASSLVIFYRPDCPFCTKLEQDIKSNAVLSNQIKKNFNVSVVDITTAEGRKIAAFYGVDKVPTIIKYDKKNKSFENIVGYFKADILKDKILNTKRISGISINQPKKASYCGDGILDAGEGCDDGNLANGDGCTNACTIQSGWKCNGSPSVCSINAVCGNGIVESGEACDDGNLANGDGCSNTCKVETAAVCGNGIVESGEACDDGNLANGDGCNNTCTVQSGWTCAGNPSVCSSTLSVDEVSNQGVFNVNIGPNPVSEKINLQFFLTQKNSVEINILDSTGKLVYQSKNKNLIIGSNNLELFFGRKLTSGNYFLNLKFEHNNTYQFISKKIMVK